MQLNPLMTIVQQRATKGLQQFDFVEQGSGGGSKLRDQFGLIKF